jgi:hypothetical protein
VRAGRRRRLSGGGFEAGSAAGQRADLGAVRVGTTTKAEVTARS